MTKTMAKGVPQLVLDKLDFPELPTGYRWRLHKPNRTRYAYLKHADDFALWVEIELDRKSKRYSEYKVVINSSTLNRDDAAWCWCPDVVPSITEALNTLADKVYDKFRSVKAAEIKKAAAQKQIDELWNE